MKIVNILLTSILFYSCGVSATNTSSKEIPDSYYNNLHKTYVDILYLQPNEKEKYQELRLKSIVENYTLLSMLKTSNKEEFEKVIDERKAYINNCSKSNNFNYCNYQNVIKNQNDIIDRIVGNGHSLEKAVDTLASYKEIDYQVFKKIRH
ncbi:hypothetical protein H5A44_00035 [Pectobacterium brasiliense]|uniref:hypothetical protein n=1 Tax=Pectobacterium brasiliense TaxID=180957 RepID=UPI001969F2BA|nr:hypothetical protein [Pectobacterium brasiliense]MBN3340821.1 hypothetical protein [Pectobacterium brasiliense]